MSGAKANLFVVGAMKAGTTSFMELLSQHPQIYVSPIKEPNYFVDEMPRRLYNPSRFFDLKTYFDKQFPNPMHIANLDQEEDYAKLFSLAKDELYLAEGSTAYLHAAETPARIAAYNPKARIVILTRDPLKRAYSHYKLDRSKGRTPKGFQALLQAEIKDYEAGKLDPFGYLGMSFYDRAIARYRALFDQVFVMPMESLAADQSQAMSDLAAWLEITPFEKRQEEVKRNAGKTLRFQKLFYILNRLGLKDFFSKWVGTQTRQRLFHALSKKKESGIQLSESLQTQLTEIFQKESAL